MSAVYCSGNHSPEQLLKWLDTTFDMAFESFTLLPFGKRLVPEKASKYKANILIISYRDYLRNAKAIQSTKFKNKNFFVFAPPFRCAEIGNSTWLDFENDPELLGISYRLTDWRPDKFSIKPDPKAEPIYRIDADFKTKVIDHIKETGSILTPFMTLIYSLSNRAEQKPVSYALAKWMYNGEPKTKLNSIFESLLKSDIKVTAKKQEKFRELLLGELGDLARQAFKLIRESKKSGKSISYDTVSKQVGIQAYDLRYISKVVQSGDTYADQEGLSIKDFQKSQDARRQLEAKNKLKAEKKEARLKATDATKVKHKKKAKPIKKKVKNKGKK